MIIEEIKNATVLEEGEDSSSIKMSLDLDSAKEIMQILSKNLYSDAIGSTVRETVSNALDSHRRAKVTDTPIIVALKAGESGNYEFTVEDFGTGLSDKEVEDVISKYGASSKRGIADELGYYGLGWKSPLAYTSSFTFIARQNGMERKYIMSEGEEENIIDLVDERETTEKNGVKIIIPISYGDRQEFISKIKEQLSYFESVYFDVNVGGERIDNGFKISRYEHFQLSELNNDPNLHICLDNVYYPLDFAKMGISPIAIPIGIRFGLSDGISPVPSRESIRYTSSTKDIIFKKIEEISITLVNLYNKGVDDTDDFKKIYAFYLSSSMFLDLGHENNINFSPLYSFAKNRWVSLPATKEPKISSVPNLDLRYLLRNDLFLDNYIIKHKLHYGKFRSSKYDGRLNLNSIFGQYKLGCNIYVFSDKIGARKKEYLKQILPSSGHGGVFVRKGKRPLFETKRYVDVAGYYGILNLKIVPRKEWRDRIKEYQTLEDIITKEFIDMESVQIPQAWLNARKTITVKTNKNKHTKLEGEMSCKKGANLEREVYGKNCKFVPYSIDLGKTPRQNAFYIYSSHENAPLLDKVFDLRYNNKQEVISFSDRELKKLKDAEIHNLISYDEFMKGNTKVFKRMITAHLIYKLIHSNGNSRVFETIDDVNTVSTDLAVKFQKMLDYEREYRSGTLTDEWGKAMEDVAITHDLFDYPMYDIYEEIKGVLNKFEFISVLCLHVSRSFGDGKLPYLNMMADLLKYNKYKVNLDRYGKKTNEEELSKEVVEELVNQNS